jgi:hypothetical protein
MGNLWMMPDLDEKAQSTIVKKVSVSGEWTERLRIRDL